MAGEKMPNATYRSSPRALARSIALVGMAGSGKTSIGKEVARLLSAPFFDSDREIESAAVMSVAAIFDACGEAGFRIRERQVITSLLAGPPCVLATGGGAFVDGISGKLLRKKALTIWLDVDAVLIRKRVGNDPSRPLLRGGSRKVSDLLHARIATYRQADVRIACGARTVAALGAEIAARLIGGDWS